jgi:hypothetical protein
LAIRRADLEEELALKAEFDDSEGAVFDDARELLLNDYVSVYEEAIQSLSTQMEVAQAEFEIMTEAKRQREEAQEAEAEAKAKEAEYNDMRATVDDAKEAKENAEAILKAA